MVRWHHQLNGHEFEQTLRDSEGQGNLACCSPWGRKESDMTEQLSIAQLLQPGIGINLGPTSKSMYLSIYKTLLIHTHFYYLKNYILFCDNFFKMYHHIIIPREGLLLFSH